jgi:hypothetical protein
VAVARFRFSNEGRWLWVPCVRRDDVCSRFSPCQSGALHLVSARFGDPFFGADKDAVVAQLVRAPVCGTGGRWFEPTQLYHEINDLQLSALIVVRLGGHWVQTARRSVQFTLDHL